MSGVRVGREIACRDDELGSEDGTHAGQGLDDLCLRMGPEHLADLLVNALEPVVQGQDLLGKAGHDLRSDILTGQSGLLGLSCLQGGGRDRVGTAHAPVGEPGGQPRPTTAAYRDRRLAARQQHQGTLVRAVVGGPFQRGKDAGQHVAEPVAHPHPVRHQVGPVSSQERKVRGQLGGHVDRGEVPAMAGGFGDDVGVAGVGLRLAP